MLPEAVLMIAKARRELANQRASQRGQSSLYNYRRTGGRSPHIDMRKADAERAAKPDGAPIAAGAISARATRNIPISGT